MSDYLSEEEQLSRLRDWWKQNGTFAIVAMVLAIAGVLGWRWYESHTAERLARAAELYGEFLESTGAARQQLADDLLAEGGSTAYPALTLLNQAHEAAAAGDLDTAANLLGQAVKAASGESLADLARLRLARVQYQLAEETEALATLGEIRSSGFVPVAQELAGDIHLATGDRAQAHASYAAALGQALGEDQQAILEIKVADTVDAAGSDDA